MKVFSINGKEVVMYTVGELAGAIGRTAQTIGKWEGQGVFPKTKFRDGSGRRLYPEQLVEKVEKIVKEEKIKRGLDMTSTMFVEKVKNAFAEVEAQLRKE